MNTSFWKDKRVLITGNTGFKGGWLSLWLHHLGAEVFGYSISVPTEPSLYRLCNLSEITQTSFADVRDLGQLTAIVDRVRPEIIFHMAAQALVRRSYVDPVETYSTNVMGTVHVMEAVRRTGGVKAVIVVTSDKCYDNMEWIWGHREIDPLGGFDPYSSSKACCELITKAYQNSFFNRNEYATHGTGIASVRAGNVIGGGDWAKDRLIPDVISSFLLKQPVIIRNPTAVRPWQHVLEPLGGYMDLGEKVYQGGQDYAEPWNFGPSEDDGRPVRWIVERLATLWGAGSTWRLDEAKNPHEAHSLRLDCSKAMNRLGWKPRWTLDTALERIVDWYRAYESDGDMRATSLGQIREYENARGE